MYHVFSQNILPRDLKKAYKCPQFARKMIYFKCPSDLSSFFLRKRVLKGCAELISIFSRQNLYLHNNFNEKIVHKVVSFRGIIISPVISFSSSKNNRGCKLKFIQGRKTHENTRKQQLRVFKSSKHFFLYMCYVQSPIQRLDIHTSRFQLKFSQAIFQQKIYISQIVQSEQNTRLWS